jgi:hypothetical protein
MKVRPQRATIIISSAPPGSGVYEVLVSLPCSAWKVPNMRGGYEQLQKAKQEHNEAWTRSAMKAIGCAGCQKECRLSGFK